MKILLLNDNPVVRKLVALSAQKTKDDLHVIWSVDEVEDDAYDLLIVDDAHYSDESMAALKEKIQYKTSLLMATRGNATPSGFDKIINKPFLPTDLVDLFAKIDDDLSSARRETPVENAKAIVLDDSSENYSDDEEAFDITNLADDLNLEDFDIEDDDSEMAVKTNVLDHEEVQELQDLLDDTDSLELEDDLSLDTFLDEESADSHDEMSDDLLKSLDDDISQALEDEEHAGSVESELDDMLDEFDTDEELALDEVEPVKAIEEDSGDEDVLGALDDVFDVEEDEVLSEAAPVIDEALDDLSDLDEDVAIEEKAAADIEEDEDLDALLLGDLVDMDDDEELAESEAEDVALSDDEFGELEQQIQEAVEDLGIEDLEQGFDEASLDDLDGLAGLGALDSLSEREIKLAIGEEVEEEEEVHIGHGDHASLDAEALSEAMEELSDEISEDDTAMKLDTQMLENSSLQEHQATPAEGIDALQALLKALSNEEVSKTLKGLSINININFGNEK